MEPEFEVGLAEGLFAAVVAVGSSDAWAPVDRCTAAQGPAGYTGQVDLLAGCMQGLHWHMMLVLLDMLQLLAAASHRWCCPLRVYKVTGTHYHTA